MVPSTSAETSSRRSGSQRTISCQPGKRTTRRVSTPAGQRGSHADAVTGGDGIGVAAVALHEDGDPDHRGSGEGTVEVRGIDGIGEEPTLVEPHGGRRTPQELVRMGEPGEAPALVEWVRLQGAGW